MRKRRRFIPIPQMAPDEIRRFHSYVRRGGPDECWPYMGASGKHGLHGKFMLQTGSQLGANRVAYFLAYRVDPKEKFVCHSCDNPPCCNPRHLWLGGWSENAKDAVLKGRWAGIPPIRSGETNAFSKLTNAQVLLIRTLHPSQSYSQLAKQFDVSKQVIAGIIKRRGWKHI